MCSIDSLRPSSHSTVNKPVARPTSFKMIERRLKHLREELKILARKQSTVDDHHVEEKNHHHEQYRKRLDQLLRLHEKQVGAAPSSEH